MDDWHGHDTRVAQQLFAIGQTEKLVFFFVVDIKFKKVVIQLSLMNRVFRINPFAVEDISLLKHFLEFISLDRCPLLEQVILRVHTFGDQMASALQHLLSFGGKVDADVCTVDFFFDD